MGSSFLVARLPGAGVLAAEATGRFPGSRVDAISFDAHDFAITSIGVVRGLPPPAFAQLHRDLEARYGAARLLASDDVAGRWVYTNRVANTGSLAKHLQFLVRLRQDFGLWWNHMSNGEYQLRAEVEDLAVAKETMARLRGHYKLMGLTPDVALAELPPAELVIRDELRGLREEFLKT